jgi:hypothetical protein
LSANTIPRSITGKVSGLGDTIIQGKEGILSPFAARAGNTGSATSNLSEMPTGSASWKCEIKRYNLHVLFVIFACLRQNMNLK